MKVEVAVREREMRLLFLSVSQVEYAMEPEPSTSHTAVTPAYFPVPHIDTSHPIASSSSAIVFPSIQPRTRLSGSQDLITLLGVDSAYSEYVKPFIPPATLSLLKARNAAFAKEETGVDVKGKGRADQVLGDTMSQQDLEQEPGKPRKMNKYYTHLMADLPGSFVCLALGAGTEAV